PHENVPVEVDFHTARIAEAFDLIVQLQHVRAVFREMQVGAADSACLHADKDLAVAGNRLSHVLAQHHATIAKDGGAHQLSRRSARSASILSSSVCSLMALTMASPARPRSWSRMSLAQSCDARGAINWPLKCGMTSRANSS